MMGAVRGRRRIILNTILTGIVATSTFTEYQHYIYIFTFTVCVYNQSAANPFTHGAY